MRVQIKVELLECNCDLIAMTEVEKLFIHFIFCVEVAAKENALSLTCL